MTKKLNCWEFEKCGREPGGAKVSEHGVCPAATEASADGINKGKNGGRICWAIAGTFCMEKAKVEFAKEGVSCMNCDFFKLVSNEENVDDYEVLTQEQLKEFFANRTKQ